MTTIKDLLFLICICGTLQGSIPPRQEPYIEPTSWHAIHNEIARNVFARRFGLERNVDWNSLEAYFTDEMRDALGRRTGRAIPNTAPVNELLLHEAVIVHREVFRLEQDASWGVITSLQFAVIRGALGEDLPYYFQLVQLYDMQLAYWIERALTLFPLPTEEVYSREPVRRL